MPPPPPPLPPPPQGQTLSPYLSTVLNPNSGPPPPRAQSSTFTSTQRTLQALNKPFHNNPPTSPPKVPTESLELRQEREQAISILENVEILLWYSNVRNESISQTRAHFTGVVLGLKGEGANTHTWKEEWEVPGIERVKRDGDVEMGGSPVRGSPRGKERRKRTSDFTG